VVFFDGRQSLDQVSIEVVFRNWPDVTASLAFVVIDPSPLTQLFEPLDLRCLAVGTSRDHHRGETIVSGWPSTVNKKRLRSKSDYCDSCCISVDLHRLLGRKALTITVQFIGDDRKAFCGRVAVSLQHRLTTVVDRSLLFRFARGWIAAIGLTVLLYQKHRN